LELENIKRLEFMGVEIEFVESGIKPLKIFCT
jgi:hypothetical protein